MSARWSLRSGRQPVLPTSDVPTGAVTNEVDEATVMSIRKKWAVVMNPATLAFGVFLAARVLTSFSIVGLVYMLLFMVYGIVCTRYRTTYAFVAWMRALPAAVLAVTLLDFLANMALQVCYALGAKVSHTAAAATVVRVMGFSELSRSTEWARYLVPQLLLLIASTRELLRHSDLLAHAQRHHYLLLLSPRQLIQAKSLLHENYNLVFLREAIGAKGFDSKPYRYQRVGTFQILTAVCIVVCGLAWPSTLSLPYTALVVRGVLHWGKGYQLPVRAYQFRLLQVYTLLYGLLQYLWQIPEFRKRLPLQMGLGLGLYEISASLKAYQLVPRVLHAMALCGLYVAIGALASKQWLHARAKEQESRGAVGHEHVVVRAEDTMVLQAAQYGISEKMARQVLGVTEPDIVFEDELESSEDEYDVLGWMEGGGFQDGPRNTRQGSVTASERSVVPQGGGFLRRQVSRIPEEIAPASDSAGGAGARGPGSTAGRGLVVQVPSDRRLQTVLSSPAKMANFKAGGLSVLPPDIADEEQVDPVPKAPRGALVRTGTMPPSRSPSQLREAGSLLSPRVAARATQARATAGAKGGAGDAGGEAKKGAEATTLARSGYARQIILMLFKKLADLVLNNTVDTTVAYITTVAEAVCGKTYVAATALCFVSLALPSFLAFLSLSLGLFVLSAEARWGARKVDKVARPIFYWLLAWFAGCYTFTALRPVLLYSLSGSTLGRIDLAHSIGLYSFDAHPMAMLPLLGILGEAFFMATVSRKYRSMYLVKSGLSLHPGVSGLTSGYQSDTSSVIQGQDTLSSPETPLGHHARPTGANRDLQRADTGNSGGGASPKRATEGAPARGGEVETRARATSPPALGTTAGAGNHAPVVTEEDVERWREQILIAMQRWLAMVEWALVYAGLPIALFAVGVSHNDVLHAIYVVFVLRILGRGVMEVVPHLEKGSILTIFTTGKTNKHYSVRLYASLHLLTMFALKMPSLCGIYGTSADLIYHDRLSTCHAYASIPTSVPQPSSTTRLTSSETTIRLFGLWDPSPVSDMIPVLVILLLATWHAFNEEGRRRRFASPSQRMLSLGAFRAAPREQPAPERYRVRVEEEEGNEEEGTAEEAATREALARQRRVVSAESTRRNKQLRGYQEALIRVAGHLATSYGIHVIVLATYVMVVVDVEPGSLVGLGYLVLICAVLLYPPLVRASIAARLGEPVDANPYHLPRLGIARWLLVTALACYALGDFLTQYALSFPLRQRFYSFPATEVTQLRYTWGFLTDPTGWQLFRKLLRPALILWLVALYRMSYRAGMATKYAAILRARRAEVTARPGAAGPPAKDPMGKHANVAHTLQRFFIRNRVGMLLLFTFFDSVRNRGALGALFLVLTALSVLTWAVSCRPDNGDHARRLSARLSLFGVAVIRTYAVATLLMLWLLQLNDLRQRLEEVSPNALNWFNWLGLPSTEYLVSAGISLSRATPDMERVLRPKALLVAFVAIEVASARWLASLPDVLRRDAGDLGEPCALFWPAPADRLEALERSVSAQLRGPKRGLLEMTLAQRLRKLAEPLLSAIRTQQEEMNKRQLGQRAIARAPGAEGASAVGADAPGDSQPGVSRPQTAQAPLGRGLSPSRDAAVGLARTLPLPNADAPWRRLSPDPTGPSPAPAPAPAFPVRPGHRRGQTMGCLSLGPSAMGASVAASLALNWTPPTGAGGARPKKHYRSLSGENIGKFDLGRAADVLSREVRDVTVDAPPVRHASSHGEADGPGARLAGSAEVVGSRRLGKGRKGRDRAEANAEREARELRDRKERTLRANLQMRFAGVGLMVLMERGWLILGREAASLFLLLAAFSSFSVISFALVALAVLLSTTMYAARAPEPPAAKTGNAGDACGEGASKAPHAAVTRSTQLRRVYPWVMAIVCGILTYQYLVFVGLPPNVPGYHGPDYVQPYAQPVPRPTATTREEFAALQGSSLMWITVGRWLGYRRVESATVWFLFFAFACMTYEYGAIMAQAWRSHERADVENPVAKVPKLVHAMVKGLRRDEAGLLWSRLSTSHWRCHTVLDALRFYAHLLLLESAGRGRHPHHGLPRRATPLLPARRHIPVPHPHQPAPPHPPPRPGRLAVPPRPAAGQSGRHPGRVGRASPVGLPQLRHLLVLPRWRVLPGHPHLRHAEGLQRKGLPGPHAPGQPGRGAAVHAFEAPGQRAQLGPVRTHRATVGRTGHEERGGEGQGGRGVEGEAGRGGGGDQQVARQEEEEGQGAEGGGHEGRIYRQPQPPRATGVGGSVGGRAPQRRECHHRSAPRRSAGLGGHCSAHLGCRHAPPQAVGICAGGWC